MSDHSGSKEAAAKARGLVIVAPGDRQLFVDIDDWESMGVFSTLVEVLNKFRPCTWRAAPSPSRKAGRFHVTVTFNDGPPLTNLERLALQAMLGSDRLHELLSYRGHFAGDPTPTVFEKPEDLPAVAGAATSMEGKS